MEVRIQAIHFEVAEKLTAFINKKAEKLARRNPAITSVDVTLKVVKPETVMNKEAIIKVVVPQHEDMVADKTANTFEEAVDQCLDALERQVEKIKEKK